MIPEIKETLNIEEKLNIVAAMVKALPAWFDEGTTISEVMEALGSFENTSFFVAYDKQEALGFIALNMHSHYTAEIAIMAVLAQHHGRGIGRKLVTHAEAFVEGAISSFSQ